MTPTPEDHEAAARIVDDWREGFSPCPHEGMTRVCECDICLEALIAAALSAPEKER